MSTAGTITHRYLITGSDNPAFQVSKNRYNDSLIVASAAPDGALMVRDSAQTDGWGFSSSPVLTTVIVGGATAPSGVEGYFVSISATDPRGLMSAQYSSDVVGARLHLRKGRGTEAAPLIITTGDVLSRIRTSGYDGANYLQMASIDVVSTGTIAATRVPTYMAFLVATNAAPSVLTEVLRLSTSLMTVPIPVTQTLLALAAVSTDGYVLQNTTPATSGVPVQMPPRFKMSGTAYNSTSTLSETRNFLVDVLPATVAGPTTALLRIGTSLDAGSVTFPLTLSNLGALTVLSSITSTGGSVTVAAGGAYSMSGRAALTSPNNGVFNLTLQNLSIGTQLKMDALPTIASGGGTSPAITAGSTALAGSITLGTGSFSAVVINFNGAAFPSVPFPTFSTKLGSLVICTAISTTQMTLGCTGGVNFIASDVISWHTMSSK